jgi:hypothetical protein
VRGISSVWWIHIIRESVDELPVGECIFNEAAVVAEWTK